MTGVFFAAWLVMPGVPAVMGFAPSPPEAPSMGYTVVSRPYTVEQYRSPYVLPDEVTQFRVIWKTMSSSVSMSRCPTLPMITGEHRAAGRSPARIWLPRH